MPVPPPQLRLEERDLNAPDPERERLVAIAVMREHERRTGRCAEHDYPLSLCPFGCAGLAL